MAKQKAKKQVKKSTPAPPKDTTPFLIKHALWVSVALAILAVVLRLYRIGYLTFWVDEYVHIMSAKNFIDGNGAFLAGEKNGILITLVTTLSFMIFGEGELAARVPMALFGAGTIPLIYLLGKSLFGKRTGLLAAAFAALSLYLIYWSRLDRHYSMLCFAFTLLLYVFYQAFETVKENPEGNWFERNGLNKKFTLWLIPAFVFSFLTQQLTFLFLFGLGFYGSFVAVKKMVTKGETRKFWNKYALLFYLTVLGVLAIASPLTEIAVRPMLEVFLPANIVTLILPDWSYISERLASEDQYNSFLTYWKVISTDFPYLWIPGLLGVLLALINKIRSGFFLVAFFVVPWLLFGFVFIEPSLPRYFIFAYPVFLIAAAYCFFGLATWWAERKNETVKPYAKFYRLASYAGIAMLVFTAPYKGIGDLITTKSHGQVVPKDLSHWYFSNWKKPAEYVKQRMQPGDIVMSTVSTAVEYYTDVDSVVWFRQNHYDASQKKYVPYEPSGNLKSARTFEEFKATVERYPRGWLLADYYFYNVMTDPNARNYAIQNMDFHFTASPDGSVQVLSWDRTKKKQYPTPLLIELGKEMSRPASDELTINVGQVPPGQAEMIVLAEGLDHSQEAVMIVNGNQGNPIAIQKTGGSQITFGLQVAKASIPSGLLKQGQNTIQFFYNTQASGQDIRKGFVIYNVQISG